MYFSYKDLTTKNEEELASIQTDLLNEEKCIQKELIQLSHTTELYRTQLKQNKDTSKLIHAELKRRKYFEEIQNIFNDTNIEEGALLLSKDELCIIYNGMDLLDYRSISNKYPRYIDLERICERVIEIKKNYPNWILADLKVNTVMDRMPPVTGYKYKYKDNAGRIFEY